MFQFLKRNVREIIFFPNVTDFWYRKRTDWVVAQTIRIKIYRQSKIVSNDTRMNHNYYHNCYL